MGAVKGLLRTAGEHDLASHLDLEAAAIIGRVATPKTLDILRTFIRKR
jgi:hypothetical protein